MKIVKMMTFILVCCLSQSAFSGQPNEGKSVQLLADILMDNSNEYAVAHITPTNFLDPKTIYEEIEEIPRPSKDGRKSFSLRAKYSPIAKYLTDIKPYATLANIVGTIPERIYVYEPLIIRLGSMPSSASTFTVQPDVVERVAILGRALKPSGEPVAFALSPECLENVDFLNYENLFQFPEPEGILPLSYNVDHYPQEFRPEHLERYPARIVSELQSIAMVMSGGGDTNALLALEAELEVDFSRKLVQEIVRRKQPPTQEEIWREEIAALWCGGWSGAAARGEDIWELIKNYERQIRAAHAAGEISDDTYLEMMKLLRLDLIKDPNATHLNRR